MSILALALAPACDGAGGDAKTAEAKGDAKPADAKAEVEIDAATDRPSDLCKAFDEDAVASALGWSGLDKVSGVGGSASGIRHRTCSFKGEGGATTQHFGVSFSTATDFEAQHAGFSVKYEPRAPVGGYETRVAKNDRVVVLQLQTPELRITVDATEEGKGPAALEPKLEAAAVALIGSLPADAKAILQKK